MSFLLHAARQYPRLKFETSQTSLAQKDQMEFHPYLKDESILKFIAGSPGLGF